MIKIKYHTGTTKPLPPIATQRGVDTVVEAPNIEAAVCPYCNAVNRGTWHELTPGHFMGIDPKETCQHFSGFWSAGGAHAYVLFRGWSNELKEEENREHNNRSTI